MTTVIGTTHALKSFDRAHDADRRCDHALATEQRGTHDAERHEHRRVLAQAIARGQQRGQGENAAFSLVVGAHDDAGVLDGDDQQQRVEDE